MLSRQKLELMMIITLCVSADPKIPPEISPATQQRECVDFIIEMFPHSEDWFHELIMTALCVSANQTALVHPATLRRECVPSLHHLVMLFLIITHLNSYNPKRN